MNEILKMRLNVNVPTKCSIHQCVKSAYGFKHYCKTCCLCEHYHRSIHGKCRDCLSTEDLDAFKLRHDLVDKCWITFLFKKDGLDIKDFL